ncbi:CsbD family protein [Rhizobium tumorigenes]|uniref:CsbD family protein n=1 Tax=Rhizobium tumorigenes TaxID=2041385 RepID=A0AAF1K3Q0_9HYPH|nr:CsbD family protein [Rhizobium tumorigenes]WFR95084.1 CsbD family protein [Rhizobium tumorigenes]
MSSTTDKASGLANEAIGNIKQGVGKLVGSEKLQAEGKLQEIKGEGQQAAGEAKDAVKDGARKASDYLDKKL